MSTAIAKNLMAEMKRLGMFAAFDQAVTQGTGDRISYLFWTTWECVSSPQPKRRICAKYSRSDRSASRRCSQRRSPLDHCQEVISDPVITDAIRDRLEHAALTIQFTGESYRGVKFRERASKKQEKGRATITRYRLRL
jgi:hypothetical protein